MAEERHVSVTFEIAYEGRRDAHAMDVQLLAPAMLALGELVKEANAALNGGRSTVQLSVQADFQHKCFLINFELLQTIYEQVKGLLSDDGVRSAKELLEWLDLFKMAAGGGGGIGLFAFQKWLRGRKITGVTKLGTKDDRGRVEITVGTGASIEKIEIHQNVYTLAENPRVRRAVPQVLAPLDTDEYDRLEVRAGGATVKVIDEKDADDIKKAAFRKMVRTSRFLTRNLSPRICKFSALSTIRRPRTGASVTMGMPYLSI